MTGLKIPFAWKAKAAPVEQLPPEDDDGFVVHFARIREKRRNGCIVSLMTQKALAISHLWLLEPACVQHPFVTLEVKSLSAMNASANTWHTRDKP